MLLILCDFFIHLIAKSPKLEETGPRRRKLNSFNNTGSGKVPEAGPPAWAADRLLIIHIHLTISPCAY